MANQASNLANKSLRCKHIPRPKFDVSTPNTVHQADPFLPHDTPGRGRRRKIYKNDLTVVDVTSCFKEAELLTWKDCWSPERFLKKLRSRAFELATVALGRPLPDIHGRCQQRNGKTTFVEGAQRFTGTRYSWKDITAPLLNACSDTSVLLKRPA